MKINDEFYILQNNCNPVQFLGDDEKHKYTGVDEFKSAIRGSKRAMEMILEEYNERTLHSLAPDYHIVKVKVTYEF